MCSTIFRNLGAADRQLRPEERAAKQYPANGGSLTGLHSVPQPTRNEDLQSILAPCASGTH